MSPSTCPQVLQTQLQAATAATQIQQQQQQLHAVSMPQPALSSSSDPTQSSSPSSSSSSVPLHGSFVAEEVSSHLPHHQQQQQQQQAVTSLLTAQLASALGIDPTNPNASLIASTGKVCTCMYKEFCTIAVARTCITSTNYVCQ